VIQELNKEKYNVIKNLRKFDLLCYSLLLVDPNKSSLLLSKSIKNSSKDNHSKLIH